MRRPLFLGVLLGLCACNPQSPAPSPSPSPATATAASPSPRGGLSLHITAQGTAKQPVRAVEQKGNRTDYELEADSAESTGPSGKIRAVFHNARITFYDRTGSTLSASAPQAILDQAQNTVTLIDGVNARTGSGMTLQCQTLVYDRATQMLHGSGSVVIRDPNGFRGTGSSFDSDISLTHYRMQ